MAVAIDMDTGSPDQNLANAIILQTATDYRKARAYLRAHKDDSDPDVAAKIRRAKREVAEDEAFFKSRGFETLTNLDGRELLEKLRKEADDAEGAGEDMASEAEAADDGILGNLDIISWL